MTRRTHEIWNTLFQNWPPNIIAAEATRYLPPGFIFIAIPLARRRLHSEPDWHRQLRERRGIRTELWEELVSAKNHTPEEIAITIKRDFFDPEFELMVVSRSQTTVALATGGG